MTTIERYEVALHDGTVVLGKLYKGEVCPLHYSNRSQAEQAAQREGGVVIHRGRPFYVRVGRAEEALRQ